LYKDANGGCTMQKYGVYKENTGFEYKLHIYIPLFSLLETCNGLEFVCKGIKLEWILGLMK
jgi:hypothetical protein